jgi:hypothetical protein
MQKVSNLVTHFSLLLKCVGGRPDLAGNALKDCIAPTLLIVGGLDYQVRSKAGSAAN